MRIYIHIYIYIKIEKEGEKPFSAIYWRCCYRRLLSFSLMCFFLILVYYYFASPAFRIRSQYNFCTIYFAIFFSSFCSLSFCFFLENVVIFIVCYSLSRFFSCRSISFSFYRWFWFCGILHKMILYRVKVYRVYIIQAWDSNA